MGGGHPGAAPAVSIFILSGARRDGTVSGRNGVPAQTASGDLFARHLSDETWTAAGCSDSRRVGTALTAKRTASRRSSGCPLFGRTSYGPDGPIDQRRF